MSRLRKIFSRIEDEIESVKKEEGILAREESADRQYIQDILESGVSRGELEKAVNLFSDEVDQAVHLGNNILDLESDVVSLEDSLLEGNFSQRVIDRFRADEEQVENIVNIFEEEVEALKNDSRYLDKIVKNQGRKSVREKFYSSLDRLESIDEGVERIERRKDLTRRKFVKLTGAVAATGVGAGCLNPLPDGDEDSEYMEDYGFEECDYLFNSEKIGPELEEILVSMNQYGSVDVIVDFQENEREKLEKVEAESDRFRIFQWNDTISQVNAEAGVCLIATLSNEDFVNRIDYLHMDRVG